MITKIARMPARATICTAKNIITKYMGTKQHSNKYVFSNWTDTNMITKIAWP